MSFYERKAKQLAAMQANGHSGLLPKDLEQRRYIDIENSIYEYLFYVIVPTQLSRNPSDVRLFGTSVSGYHERDKLIHDEMHPCAIPIIKIAEYHRDAIPMRYNQNTELDKMYEFLNEYLIYWADQLQSGCNISNAPYEQLIIFDALANDIFEVAKYEYDKILPVPKAMRVLLSRETDMLTGSYESNVSDVKHNSLSDLFKKYAPKAVRMTR